MTIIDEVNMQKSQLPIPLSNICLFLSFIVVCRRCHLRRNPTSRG